MNRLSEISRGVSILGLERVSELLFLMGDPQERTHIVHVAGTNGKGSFTAMLSSVLKSAGYRVGSFSSPAILGANESFRIDGEVISEERLNELINRIAPFAESMITAGGVSLKDVAPETLLSRLHPTLAFAGEILDLQAPTGGYNLHFAFASARLAALTLLP